MSLFTASFALSMTDRLGFVYEKLVPIIASADDSDFWPTDSVQSEIDNLTELMADGGDRDVQLGLMPAFNTLASTMTIEVLAALLKPGLDAIDSYCATNGPSVDASIVSLDTFLSYYNGGAGGSKFSALVTPEFATLWTAAGNTALSPAYIMSPGIHPDIIENGSAYGMGQRAVGGSYLDGDPTDADAHTEVEPLVEIVVDFASATANTTIEIFGTDDTGAESTTWTTTIRDSLNPTSTISITTVPAITIANEKQFVVVSDQRGIVPGSVLEISTDFIDQETIIVEDTDTFTMHPDLNSNLGSAGMGLLNFGTPFADGTAVDSDHTEVSPMIEVIDNFADSTAAPVISVEGIDDTGLKVITGATNATPIVITSVAHGLTTGNVVAIKNVLGNTAANGTWTVTVVDANTFSLQTSVGNGAYTSGGNWYMTWSATLTGNNPVSAVATTITPAITATGLQTVAIGSATGIVEGSVLLIDDGLSTEEFVSVIAISGTNITAVFAQTHLAGADVDTLTTKALTPSVSGRRLKKVVGMTITAADITEGGVRVVGKQQQMIQAAFKKEHAAGVTLTGKRTYTLTPSVAGRRLQNILTISALNAADITAGTVRVVGRRDRVVV